MVLLNRSLIIILAYAFTSFCPSVDASDRPNVLLIVSEDNGPELGCYGDPYAQTPHLDRLAGEGIIFRRAYVPQSGCSQSRASYLTGLYPHQHGQLGLATWGFRLYDDETPNLPRLLKGAGYRTGIIGKLHINPGTAFPFDFKAIPSANFQRKDLKDYEKYAEAFINGSDQPFFLSINYPEAHDPWIRQVNGIPKQPLDGDDIKPMAYMGVDHPALRELVADYYNCISRLDSLVGDLLQVLEDSGKADDTMVIYLGDHGADMLRGKRTCYEGGLRIPMIIRWPGHIRQASSQQFVSTIDLLPTILKAINLEVSKALPGVPLQPLFAGKLMPKQVFREYLFAEYHTHAAAPNYFPQRSVRGDRFKLILSLLPNTEHPDYSDTIRKLHGDHASRNSTLKLDLPALIASAPTDIRRAFELMRCPPEVQLYDLRNDPYEFHNLANSPDHQLIKTTLLNQLHQWRVNTSDPLLKPSLLRRLTNEVQSITNKTLARKHTWQYPRYFSEGGRTEPSTSPDK